MAPIDAKRARIPGDTYHRVKVAAAEEMLTIEQLVGLVLTAWLDERDAARSEAATRPLTPPLQP